MKQSVESVRMKGRRIKTTKSQETKVIPVPKAKKRTLTKKRTATKRKKKTKTK